MKKIIRLFIALIVLIATICIVYAIAVTKNQNMAGGDVYKLVYGIQEYEKIDTLLKKMSKMGAEEYSSKITDLLKEGKVWIALNLHDKQGVYINSLNIIKRIYIDKNALMNSVAFFEKLRSIDIAIEYLEAFAELTLVGTILHEYIHYSGIPDENYVYQREIDFYQKLKDSEFYNNLNYEQKEYYNWAIESAIKSAIKAREYR